jgi:hypothetical protein
MLNVLLGVLYKSFIIIGYSQLPNKRLVHNAKRRSTPIESLPTSLEIILMITGPLLIWPQSVIWQTFIFTSRNILKCKQYNMISFINRIIIFIYNACVDNNIKIFYGWLVLSPAARNCINGD